MKASVKSVDFTKPGADKVQSRSGGPIYDAPVKVQPPMTLDGKLLTPKQIRARARRRMKRNEVLSAQEMDYLYRKPVHEWDLEELAKGRPRGPDGTFRGDKPKWITREVHEAAMDQYLVAVKSKMNQHSVDALDVIHNILNNNDVDDNGKPVVSPSTKLDTAKFLLEHVIGKPTQRVESDVSVKLQSILGVVMGNPAETITSPTHGGAGYNVGHYPGVTMAMSDKPEGEMVIDAEWDEDDD